MKQIIYDKSGRVRVKKVPVPEIDEHEVLVKNIYSVMSAGTEKSMIELMKKPLWKMALDRPDLARQVLQFAKKSGVKKTMDLVKSRLDVWHLLGYSSAGIAVKIGSKVENISIGDKVACIGSGAANHAEYVAVPKTLLAKVPKKVDLKDAAYTGIACIALQSIRQLKPQLGENIVVVGLGMIGQMVSQILRANGCNVIGIDIDKKKTSRKYIDTPISKDTVNEVRKATNGVGADGVIIAATSKHNLVNDSFDMCRKKGRVVLLGISGMDIDRSKMFEKELTFKISTAFGAGAFDMLHDQYGKTYPVEYARWTSGRNMQAVLDLIATDKLNFDDTKVFDISKADTAYKALNDGKLLTAIFEYDPKDDSQTIKVGKGKKSKINVAVIGAGQFVKGFIIPAIQKNKDMSLYAIATKNGPNAKKLAEQYGAKYASTSYDDILNDNNVDLVVIGTRHDSHAKISTAALKKGKNVFCEKPMAIDEKDFVELAKTIRKSEKHYACGFNRRYSPAMKAVRSNLDDGPIIANYVFNNTELPKDHWVNVPEIGGGRVIGEACHIIDLFNYLTGSKPVLIDAQSYSAGGNDSNNVQAVIKYEDGSICTLTYACVGNNRVERERCTVFQSGKVLEMDGFGKVKLNDKIIYSGIADEGHEQEIVELGKALVGKDTELLSGDDCIQATKSTFDIVSRTKKR